MNVIALQALGKLLRLTENAVARGSDKAVSLLFSEKSFPAYSTFHTRAEKESCNAELIRAEQRGAIEIEWDRRAGNKSHVNRISMKDRNVLASFISITPRWDAVALAREALSGLMESYPILMDLVAQWGKGISPRGTSSDQFQDWIDAIQVVEHCRSSTKDDIPVRRLSALLMQDSKRIEGLYSVIDALWQNNLSAQHRTQDEVFSDIGLVKFPPTFLIAGNIGVSYGGTILPVLIPYVGFSPSKINAFQIYPECDGILTVENLTTFHELATRRLECPNLVIVYTGGMPSRSWASAYRELLNAIPINALVWHWGDIDIGGFRIADRIASICHEADRHLSLHMMGCAMSDYPDSIRHEMSSSEVGQISKICEKNSWADELIWVERNRIAVEQESIPIIWPIN